MVRRLAGRGLVVGSCLLAFLGSACSPADPPPSPPSTSAAVPTPAETDQEREQRLAYEAAETSYREFRAEFYRVLSAGGAKSATPKMKATAAGPYLDNFTKVAQAYRGQKSHSVGHETIGYVRPAGYESNSLLLDVCEDSRAVKDFSDAGKYQGRGEIRTVRVEVRQLNGEWKVWNGDGEKADSCD